MSLVPIWLSRTNTHWRDTGSTRIFERPGINIGESSSKILSVKKKVREYTGQEISDDGCLTVTLSISEEQMIR